MNIYNKSINDLYDEFDSSIDGIKSSEVEDRLNKYGENKIIETKKKSKFRRFLEQFNDMMIIILIIVAIVMGIYGFLYSHDYTDTIVIAIVVLLNAIMGFIQEEKAEVTLEGLKKYTNTTCKVRRDKEIHVVDASEIVPGDIIILEAGDQIPADARLLVATNLKVDESPLTGESLPVKKMVKSLRGNRPLQEQVNMLFCGCNVVNGKAEALVVKTGMLTELGLIAVSLNVPYEVSTPLQIKMAEISKNITLLVFFIILFMFVYGVLSGYKLLEIIMLCVSLAVAAIPEGLPAVITITLSTGTAALARRKTIVRQMSAVETLGSTDIVCSDKTGTITENKMQVVDTIIHDEFMFNYISILANEVICENGKYIGDPTETSLVEYVKNKKIDVDTIREKCNRLGEAPFDSERKMMSSVNEIDSKKYLLVKGSLENLLNNCKSIIIDGKKKKLTDTLKKDIRESEFTMACRALRVIGFAYKEVKNVSENIIEDENDLIYVCMVGIIDPPRNSVKK